MTMSLITARRVAVDCIRQATGFSGEIKTSSVLSTIGVVDKDARKAVNDDIVTDTGIGVQKHGFKLGATTLTFKTSSKLSELRDEIASKSVPKSLP